MREWLACGYHVLWSDTDVIWLQPGWSQWMLSTAATRPEAAFLAHADVLLSTDELDEHADAAEGWDDGTDVQQPGRSAHRVTGWGMVADAANTGVLFLRSSPGARSLVDAWRVALSSASAGDDQSVFTELLRRRLRGSVLHSSSLMRRWRAETLLNFSQLQASPETRDVYIGDLSQCGDLGQCATTATTTAVPFSLGSLPLRTFLGGHTFFVQRLHERRRHLAAPLTAHLTFQHGDTGEYAFGKRQRAREAGLWAADPPSYYSEGLFVRLRGPVVSRSQLAKVEASAPRWHPKRHLMLDAVQRAAVRDLLALAHVLNATAILPPWLCACDRFWGLTEGCLITRSHGYPHGPVAAEMPFPFSCPMDMAFDLGRWHRAKLRFRESSFLEHAAVPRGVHDNAVRVTVRAGREGPDPTSLGARFVAELEPGTALDRVPPAVHAANSGVRLVEIGVADMARLCRSIGGRIVTRMLNRRLSYALTASHGYCAAEANPGFKGWSRLNEGPPLNCSWGFGAPAPLPEVEADASCSSGAVQLVERATSATCKNAPTCRHDVAWPTELGP